MADFKRTTLDELFQKLEDAGIDPKVFTVTDITEEKNTGEQEEEYIQKKHVKDSRFTIKSNKKASTLQLNERTGFFSLTSLYTYESLFL